MSDIAIRIEDLSKRYRIGQYVGGGGYQHRTLRDVIANAFKASFRLFHRLTPNIQGPTSDHIWALKDVSFEVKQGEIVGIIGRNGAGKTTLLKVLSRITEPTKGRAEIRGRVGSLLEVGTGFHAELTGRENIYLSGAILGMTKKEIDRKLDQIVDFSGIEKSIHTPVKRYSSGMWVRLGFAVAAHLEPEILLVDEVLAVGDQEFQKKCLGKIEDVAKGGRTVLFVSHNMEAIMGLCSRAIWLDSAIKKADGPSRRIVRKYLGSSIKHGQCETTIAERTDRIGDGRIRFMAFHMRDENGNHIRSIAAGETVEFVLPYVTAGESVTSVSVWLSIHDSFGRKLLGFWSRNTGDDFARVPSEGEFVCRVPEFPLVPGTYSTQLTVYVNDIKADEILDASTFEVVTSDFYGTGTVRKVGMFLHDYSWRLSREKLVM